MCVCGRGAQGVRPVVALMPQTNGITCDKTQTVRCVVSDKYHYV